MSCTKWEVFYRQKEGGAKKLKEWVISGRGSSQADDLTRADEEISG